MKLTNGTYLCFDTGVFIPLGGGTVTVTKKVENRELGQIKEIDKDVRSFHFFNVENGKKINYSKSYIVDGSIFTIKKFKEEAKKQTIYKEEKLKDFLKSIKKDGFKKILLDRFGSASGFDEKKSEIFLTKK